MGSIHKAILAVVTTNQAKIDGGVPIFSCQNTEEKHAVASNLEYILDALAHEVTEEMIILVKH